MNVSFEQILIPVITGAFGALLTYIVSNRSKLKDIHIQKSKELNIILSNMLSVWDYLYRIKLVLNVYEDEQQDFIIPKESVPGIILNSGMLNEKCFTDLEDSIHNLKQYDSLTYYQLEGLGIQTDTIRKQFVMPFIRSKAKTHESIKTSRHFLNKLIVDIEDGLEEVSRLISTATEKKVKAKIAQKQHQGLNEIKEEFNQEFYCYLLSVLPDQFRTLTYEEFKETFTNPEMREWLNEQSSLWTDYDMTVLMEKLSQNPEASIDELRAELNREFSSR